MTITILSLSEKPISQLYYYYQGLISRYIMIHVLSAFPNQMNFVDFIKSGLTVKIVNSCPADPGYTSAFANSVD